MMRLQYFVIFILFFLLSACLSHAPKIEFDIQGHRGTRATFPENSLIGFVEAAKIGVNTLEMDVVITKDHQVILSHEPWMSPKICLDSMGNSIVDSFEMYWNIYDMNYLEITKFDCGSVKNSNFPDQQLLFTHKPLLTDVISAVEAIHPKIQYNIEIKSKLKGDHLFHPEPEEFVTLVYNVIEKNNITSRVIIQSFDPRPLMIVNDKYPEIKTSYLTANQLGYRHNLTRLDYQPTIFSPRHDFVTQGMIDFFHKEGIKVIPWTVNDVEEMKRIKDLGADGLITDYPEKAIKVLNQ